MTDIGEVSHNLLDHTTDLAFAWTQQPWRRREFGDRELADLKEASLKLSLLLSAIETPVRERVAVYRR